MRAAVGGADRATFDLDGGPAAVSLRLRPHGWWAPTEYGAIEGAASSTGR